MSKSSKVTAKAVPPSAKSQPTPVLLVIKDIKRQTRRQYSADEKIRIVLEGLRGEISIAEICRWEGLNTNVYYRWSKEFLEAGKKRLTGDRLRATYSPIFDINDKPCKIVKFAVDVSQEKALEAAAQAQKRELLEYLKAINLTTAAVEFDLHGRIAEVNDIFRQCLQNLRIAPIEVFEQVQIALRKAFKRMFWNIIWFAASKA